jgi:hypothetical protein
MFTRGIYYGIYTKWYFFLNSFKNPLWIYLSIYTWDLLTELVTKVKPNINSVEVHPQLSKKQASSGWCPGGCLFTVAWVTHLLLPLTWFAPVPLWRVKSPWEDQRANKRSAMSVLYLVQTHGIVSLCIFGLRDSMNPKFFSHIGPITRAQGWFLSCIMIVFNIIHPSCCTRESCFS